MSDDHYLDDFPAEESRSSPQNRAHRGSFSDEVLTEIPDSLKKDPFSTNGRPVRRKDALNARLAAPVEKSEQPSRLLKLWDGLSQAGLAETAQRLGTHAMLLVLVLLLAWGMREFYLYAQTTEPGPSSAVFAAPLPTPTPTEAPQGLVDYRLDESYQSGIPRRAHLHTDVPSQPRFELSTYTVKEGDTLFGIAEQFNLQPETILWGNQYVLGDNPHNLRPGQELNILPVDGALHRWSEGDGLNGVSSFFHVTPEEIIEFPGNHLSYESIGEWSRPNIEPGTLIIIPGGRREFVSWSAPEIPLDNPEVAEVLGPGYCTSVAAGLVGSGAFVWPANAHFLSGFDYNPSANHHGIDIDGEIGDPIYAADNGVVVYAGWNNWGYGNMIVVNHGNGWQTLYAHMDAIYVTCGQSVWQTGIIGTVGNTGNSSGSHLHFEMMINGGKINPWDYLP